MLAAETEEFSRIKNQCLDLKKKNWTYFFFKRAFDITLSLFVIILFFPLFLALCLIVKFSSKGKIFFLDSRVGYKGKPIKVIKFRTMYADAESRLKEYLTPTQLAQWKEERKIDNDPRITKIGLFLRKTSLDELPQVFNILAGTISIIGPRPITLAELNYNYRPEERKILLSCKPGLTGYWQAYGRSNITFETGKRQKMELSYLNKRTLWLDLKIFFKTIPAVLQRRGAK